MPLFSIARCQHKNSSTDKEYRSQASVKLITPAWTAYTTWAFRRATQRFVFGLGKSIRSRLALSFAGELMFLVVVVIKAIFGPVGFVTNHIDLNGLAHFTVCSLTKT